MFPLLHGLKRCVPVLLWALCLHSGAAMASLEIALLLSQASEPHQRFAQHFNRGAARLGHLSASAGTVGEHIDEEALLRADLIIASGEAALQAVLKLAPQPTLATMLGREAFARQSARLTLPWPLAALTLDQPVQRQLALMQAVLPQARQLVLLHQDAADQLTAFQHGAQACGLDLALARLRPGEALLGRLEEVLRKHDALVVLPELALSTPIAVRSILLSSYRHRKPVFAFSRAYVEAGALAAVFTTPEQMADELLDWLAQQHSERLDLPQALVPSRFEVAVNRQLGRALGLDLAPDEELIRRIARGACE